MPGNWIAAAMRIVYHDGAQPGHFQASHDSTYGEALPDRRRFPRSFSRDPGIDASALPARVDPQAIECDDLPVAGPRMGERRFRRAEYGDVIQSLPRIDHGDIRTTRDKVMRDPVRDRPLLRRRRIEMRPPEFALQRPHRIEPRSPHDPSVVDHWKTQRDPFGEGDIGPRVMQPDQRLQPRHGGGLRFD